MKWISMAALAAEANAMQEGRMNPHYFLNRARKNEARHTPTLSMFVIEIEARLSSLPSCNATVKR